MLTKFMSSAALALTLAACAISAPAQAQDAHGIAATVNDDVITTHDLRQRVIFMIMASGVKPDEQSARRMQVQALRALVDERLQMQEAKKFDLTVSDAEVERSLARLAQSNGMSIQELAQQTSQFGISGLGTIRAQIEADTAWQRIVNGRYGSRIRISDTQINETLNRLSANADKPSYLASEIYIEATPDIGGMDGAMEGAKAMISQMEQGAPFTALARQFSSSATAVKGGDIGWINQGELRTELNEALTNLQKGEISNPIQVPGGVYVLALRDTKESKSDTLYRVKQVRIPTEDEAASAAAAEAVRNIATQLESCDNFEDIAETIEGANTADMGEVKASELNEQILTILAETNVGDISKPIVAPSGVMALMVCNRQVQGVSIPTRDQIEDRLIDQQIAQQSKRYLRDLRRSATIESR